MDIELQDVLSDGVNKADPIKVRASVEVDHLALLIHPAGWGIGSDDDFAPIVLENYGGVPRLLVWAEGDTEEPTHVIELHPYNRINVKAADDWELVAAVTSPGSTARLPEPACVEILRETWKLQDGYGKPGYTPVQGWDWSGIRDSSPKAVSQMARVIREILEKHGIEDIQARQPRSSPNAAAQQ